MGERVRDASDTAIRPGGLTGKRAARVAIPGEAGPVDSSLTSRPGPLVSTGGRAVTNEPHLIRRRLRFERNFTQLPNAWLRDERLSFRARGVLAMLMTHEHGWKVTLKAVAGASAGEGIDAVRSAVAELERYGYLVRHPIKARGRFQGDHWELVDPFEAVDNSLFTALDHPTRSATALDDPMRTALDDPTPIEHKKKTSKTHAGDHRRGRAGVCGELDPPLACVYVPDATTCERCGLSRDGTYRVDVLTGAVL
jgi:hypothetical protein